MVPGAVGYRCVDLLRLVLLVTSQVMVVLSNPDARRLYETLMIGYNKLLRPVENDTDVLKVKFTVKLSQLLDVAEKTQIMTTNVWLKQVWHDFNLQWNPDDYGGVRWLHISPDMIWLPDIVLYNNADGHYQVSIMTKALLFYNGTVIWEPPAIYKSMCQNWIIAFIVNIEFFPFDEQTCELRFGSWTYDGFEVDLVHFDSKRVIVTRVNNKEVRLVQDGIDLSEFYASVEWDIMGVPAERHEEKYPCCPAPYIDITYSLILRRKTLFYTINLIVPCVGISFLTILVFYLPSDSGEKVTLCISILISLTVFFLLLVEIIPSTSLVIPLIAKYLLFTMVMVTCSIVVTVVTLNTHFRGDNSNNMPRWIRVVFLRYLPRLLLMRRPKGERLKCPKQSVDFSHSASGIFSQSGGGISRSRSDYGVGGGVSYRKSSTRETDLAFSTSTTRESLAELLKQFTLQNPFLNPGSTSTLFNLGYPEKDRHVHKDKSDICDDDDINWHAATKAAKRSAGFIADHFKKKDDDDKIKEDWRYVALVLDRLFLWVFTATLICGIFGIIFAAPVIFDKRTPIVV